MSLPKLKAFNSNIKAPKITAPRLGFVSNAKIGYAKPVLANAVKAKIKLK